MIFPYRSIAYESAGIIPRYSDEATTTESLKVFSFATGTVWMKKMQRETLQARTSSVSTPVFTGRKRGIDQELIGDPHLDSQANSATTHRNKL